MERMESLRSSGTVDPELVLRSRIENPGRSVNKNLQLPDVNVETPGGAYAPRESSGKSPLLASFPLEGGLSRILEDFHRKIAPRS